MLCYRRKPIDYSYYYNKLALARLHDLQLRCGLPLTKEEDYKPYSPINEVRYNPYHDKSGKFASKSGGDLTRHKKSSKIKAETISGYEKEIVSSAIATSFPDLKADGMIRLFSYGDYSYAFKVKSTCVYEFKGKIKIKGRVR